MHMYIYIHVYYDAGVFDQQKHMCVYYDYLTHSLGIQKGRAGTGSKLWVWPLSATKGCQANGASTDWLLFFFARVQFPRILIYVWYIYIYMRMASATARATYDNIWHGRLQLMTNTNMALLPLRAGRPRLRGSSRWEMTSIAAFGFRGDAISTCAATPGVKECPLSHKRETLYHN